jgi:hypothetical protein
MYVERNRDSAFKYASHCIDITCGQDWLRLVASTLHASATGSVSLRH